MIEIDLNKVYCPEVDCEGIPDCPCCTDEYWKRWRRSKYRENIIKELNPLIEYWIDEIYEVETA